MATLADRLALDRTNLANERTLLAYVRTALALAATGVAIPRLVGTHPVLEVIQWTLVALGLATTSVTGCARQASNRQVAYHVLIVAGFVVLGAAQSGCYYSSATPPPPRI